MGEWLNMWMKNERNVVELCYVLLIQKQNKRNIKKFNKLPEVLIEENNKYLTLWKITIRPT